VKYLPFTCQAWHHRARLRCPAPGDSPATCASRVTRSHRSATSCIWRVGRSPLSLDRAGLLARQPMI